MTRRGDRHFDFPLTCGVMTYVLWGLIPLYFKTVADIASVEVLAHRIIWSLASISLLIGVQRRWADVGIILRNAKLLLTLFVSASLISATWLIFICCVANGQVLQASLGYFISPVMNVLLGMAILHERLRPWQIFAVALAIAGIFIQAGLIGQMPWLAILLATTTALHVLVRKIVPTDGVMSLAFETFVMAPIALAYVGWLIVTKENTASFPQDLGLLILSGPVTTVPFLFFGVAAKGLRLSTMGIIQYLMPTLQFLLAVVVFQEPLSLPLLASFVCVWFAIVIYASDDYRRSREGRSIPCRENICRENIPVDRQSPHVAFAPQRQQSSGVFEEEAATSAGKTASGLRIVRRQSRSSAKGRATDNAQLRQ